MAHVTKTKHGYELKLHIGNNKYRSRSVRLPHTKAGKHEAEQLAANWQVQHDRSKQDLTTTPTVAQVANKWQRISAPTWSENHAKYTRVRLDSHILPYWGDRHIRDVTLLEVQEWFAGLTRMDGEPMKPSSIASYKATFSGLFDFAVDHGFAARNLCRSVKLPKIEQTKKLPDVGEIRRILRTTDDPRWHAFVHLAAVTGMRRGEMCAMRWSDIGDDGSLRIRHSVTASGSLKGPKSKRGNRDIPLQPKTLALLEALRAERPYHSDDSYVFSDAHDGAKPLLPDTASKWFAWNRIGKELKLHDLRHHAASQMLAAGVDIPTVAFILGQDPAVTLGRYAHAVPQKTDRAMRVLAGLV